MIVSGAVVLERFLTPYKILPNITQIKFLVEIFIDVMLVFPLLLIARNTELESRSNVSTSWMPSHPEIKICYKLQRKKTLHSDSGKINNCAWLRLAVRNSLEMWMLSAWELPAVVLTTHLHIIPSVIFVMLAWQKPMGWAPDIKAYQSHLTYAI